MISTTPALLVSFLACSPVQTTVLDTPASSETQTDMAPPSATPRPAELQARLDRALAALPASYVPRTHHLDPQGAPLWSNRLLLEQSPYLIQHAHNPVDWHPWGDEAFTLAEELGRPVLLSVGYSTCHWCHVMEKESFEDLEIAAYINENYIPIKVDREERPDVDEIYMTAVHLLNGRGGWPMTVWLTPDRTPFYAGTYFPARTGDRGSNRPGFFTLLQELERVYQDHPLEVADQAESLTAELRRVMAPAGKGTRPPGTRELNAALSSATKSFDSTWGGRQGRPKFPSSFPLRLLMRAYQKTGDPALLDMVELTLDQMAAGGIYDQIGGGFHRYSTDSRWLVPHFEKMLYDNAILAVIYLEAYQLSGHDRHARVARDILEYVRREMTRPEGGFWSATDADSMGADGHREEGLFFIWTPDEVLEVLGPERTAIALEVYGVTDRGNFEGSNILTRRKTLESSARTLRMEVSKLETELEQIRLDLRAARSLRPPPLLDDKMLSAWNGLMISAFATGARVLQDPSLAQVAIDASEAILRDNRIDGQLARSSREGVARHTGLLEDHAFLCAGLLDLFETTGNPRWLDEAIHLDDELESRFEDPDGGFYRTPLEHEQLLVREKPNSDGAIPSGNSVHALNLLRLAELTTDASYTRRAEKTLQSLGTTLRTRPSSMDELLLAADWRQDLPRELILVLPQGSDLQQPHSFSEIWSHRFLPNAIRVAVTEGEDQQAMSARVPLVQNKLLIDGEPTMYLCEQGSCQQPTTDPEVLARQLNALETSE